MLKHQGRKIPLFTFPKFFITWKSLLPMLRQFIAPNMKLLSLFGSFPIGIFIGDPVTIQQKLVRAEPKVKLNDQISDGTSLSKITCIIFNEWKIPLKKSAALTCANDLFFHSPSNQIFFFFILDKWILSDQKIILHNLQRHWKWILVNYIFFLLDLSEFSHMNIQAPKIS